MASAQSPSNTPSLIARLLRGEELRETPLKAAHFVEEHYIHPSLEWTEAARLLQVSFPKDTRFDRPRPWYGRLAGTHWPAGEGRRADVPPGNGPFYVPAWTFEDMAEADQKAMFEALKRMGFKRVIAHVVYLPENNEYLVPVMRAAGEYRWTANPLTYRGYIYPSLGKAGKRDGLREYTTERWKL